MIVNRMGGIVLSHGPSISRNPVASVADGQPAPRQAASGDGPYPVGGDPYVGPDRARHGVQCERDCRWESVSRFGFLSQATSGMARVWVFAPAPDLANRLHAVGKTVASDPGLHGDLVGHGIDTVARCGGKGRPPLVAIGTDFDSASRVSEAGRSDVSRSLPDEERREDQALSRWAAARIVGDQSNGRIDPSRTGFGYRRRYWARHHGPVLFGRRENLASARIGSLRVPSGPRARVGVQLSASTTLDVPGSMEGFLGCWISDHSVVPSVRKRRFVRCGVGRRQAKALFLAGGPHRF